MKPELLAPAGDIDCLKAAILAGADAVYLAGKRFGARAFAKNFDEETLKWARNITKAHNKKLYITLNTLIFDYEWKLLNEALDFYENLQPDALIIQDLGIAAELCRRKNRIPLHLSTQGAWYGVGGTDELKELGFTRIILPRETTKKEIEYIVKHCPFEIEMFVHGAMCYSISGRCYWSSALGTRSGNRGTCAQPCRKEYFLNGNKNGSFVFSPKDLRLINKVNEICKSGVSSLKIEGRMKSPEYVFRVVSAYRNALDGKQPQNISELSEVFSRANSIGFFEGIPTPDKWKTGQTSGREGVIVAITTGKTQDGLTEVKLIEEIYPGDGISWTDKGEKKGTKITWVKKEKNFAWLRGLPNGIKKQTELYRTSTSKEGNWALLWNKDSERFPVRLKWNGKIDEFLTVETEINNQKISAKSEEKLSKALKQGLEEPINSKFKAIGESFKVSYNDFSGLDSNLYISTNGLKTIKRSLNELLCNALTKTEIKPYKENNDFSSLFEGNQSRFIRVKIFNNSFPFSKNLPSINEWLIPLYSDIEKAARIVGKNKLAFWLPPVLNKEQLEKTIKDLSQLKSGKFVCFGWECFELAKRLPQLSFSFDWSFNIANLSALDFIREHQLDAVFSKEWRNEEIPDNLIGIRYAPAWNQLVSYTRFPKAISQSDAASNSHNDKFFTLEIGNGVTAMFLEKRPKAFKLVNKAYQLDIALSEKEKPTWAFEFLSGILN